MAHPDKRSPAPRGNADRAKGNQHSAFSTITATAPEADFAAAVIAQRYGLSLSVARLVAHLAHLGRALAWSKCRWADGASQPRVGRRLAMGEAHNEAAFSRKRCEKMRSAPPEQNAFLFRPVPPERHPGTMRA